MKVQKRRKEKLKLLISEKEFLLKKLESGEDLQGALKNTAREIQEQVKKLPTCQKELLDNISKSSSYFFQIELGEMKLQQLEIKFEKQNRLLDEANLKLQNLKEEQKELDESIEKNKKCLVELCKQLTEKGWKRNWKDDVKASIPEVQSNRLVF